MLSSFNIIALLSLIILQSASLEISRYTGAGVSPELQDQIMDAIINAYNRDKQYYLGDQAQYISEMLTKQSKYQFTVIIINENPTDSWFSLQSYDQIYVVWPGVNKMLITWTYLIFANGLKNDGKVFKQVFYQMIGSGISANQKLIIQSAIANLEVTSCLFAGKELAGRLSELDSKPWTSICKPITQPKPEGQYFSYLLTDNNQYYLGKGKKCNCLVYV